jgi:hypothetical protein
MAKKNADATSAPRRRTTTPRRATASDPAPAPVDVAPVAGTEPSYDEIAQAAYLRYISRGGADGKDFDDWLAAEQELKGRKTGVGR